MHKKTLQLDDWHLWCRLCAKEDPTDNVSVFFKNEQEMNDGSSGAIKTKNNGFGNSSRDLGLVAAIEKYFCVNITRMEELPKMLCTDCLTLVTSLMNFSERVTKVQQMFFTLLENEHCVNVDLHGTRMKYGLLDENREHVLMQKQPQPLEEVHYFQAKPEVNEWKEKIYDNKTTITNPLEQQTRIHIKIKKEQILVKDMLHNDDNERVKDFEISNALDRLTGTASDDEISVLDKKLKLDQITLKAKQSNVQKSSDSIAKKSQKKRRKNSKRAYRSEDDDDDDDLKEKNVNIKKEETAETTFTCSECPSKFKRLGNYQIHMKTKCPRIYKSQLQLDKHAKTDLQAEELKNTCICPYCDKKFGSNTLVHTHIRHIHLDERPFVCEECGIAVRTNSALKTHMLIHSDYAAFECEICKKRFKHRPTLKLHMETHNTDHKHICPECGQQLNSSVTLKRHLLVHSDKMQHKCDYCGREFKRAKALKNHLILHTGLKPFLCDFCDRTFASGSNCRSHKKKAHAKELAAQEAAGGAKNCTRNIPKLETLKAITKAADNLAIVVSKQSGCFASSKKLKTPLKLDTNKSTLVTTSASIAALPATST